MELIDNYLINNITPDDDYDLDLDSDYDLDYDHAKPTYDDYDLDSDHAKPTYDDYDLDLDHAKPTYDDYDLDLDHAKPTYDDYDLDLDHAKPTYDDYDLDLDLAKLTYGDLDFDLAEITCDDYDLDFDLAELTYDYYVKDLDPEDSGNLEVSNLDGQNFSVTSLCLIPEKVQIRFAAAFTVLTTVGVVVSVWNLGKPFWEEYNSERKYEKLRQESLVALTEDAALEDISMSKEDFPMNMKNPYEDIFSQNEDMVAWLVVEDTVIDYPVMQTMRNEEYYLHRDFYGKRDVAGCLLMDTDSSLYDSAATSNLIIHGHNMKRGTMFGSLDQYKEQDYWQEHQYIDLYTKNELREYQVIAVFYSQVYYPSDQVFKYYNFFNADTEESFADFYNNIKTLSLYDTGVEAQLGDQFLTLTTCAYHVEEGRFVVVCKERARSQQF